MRASSRCSASAAPPASTPAGWRAPPARAASWCIRWRACSRRSASAWRIGSPCAARACAARWMRRGWPRPPRRPLCWGGGRAPGPPRAGPPGPGGAARAPPGAARGPPPPPSRSPPAPPGALVPMGALRAELEGPALIVEAHSTVVLEEGWRARRLPGGELLLEERGALRRPRAAAAADPARIEIFNNLFMHIAEQMGEVLKSTAQSVNIRERLDYSCALFDADGGLVANAPHMPVHLGSMGASVRAVIAARRGRLEPGDSWLLNSPYHGGTHLPDMTVVTPVFMGAGARPRFFVASRAHHADIGGMTPGSMPPFSRTIEEEGAL